MPCNFSLGLGIPVKKLMQWQFLPWVNIAPILTTREYLLNTMPGNFFIAVMAFQQKHIYLFVWMFQGLYFL